MAADEEARKDFYVRRRGLWRSRSRAALLADALTGARERTIDEQEPSKSKSKSKRRDMGRGATVATRAGGLSPKG